MNLNIHDENYDDVELGPEDWNTSQENGYLSKMHGCYNGIGLWFIEGLAGIVVDASKSPPLSFRAAVEAGDITWVSGAR